jgi:DegV family protein with EDD domain
LSDYILSCCSTADLSREHLEGRGIPFICFHYFLNGVEYEDDLGRSIPFEEFYRLVAEGAETRTSQVNITEYLDYFTRFLEEGKDILHITLSSGISGSYGSACNAALIARERFPARKIYIVDSLGASSGYGLLMDKLADLRDSGMGIEDLHDWAEAHKLDVHHWFFSTTDLTYYKRGGASPKRRRHRRAAQHLPAARHGRRRPPDSAQQNPHEAEGHSERSSPVWKNTRRTAQITPENALSSPLRLL